MAAVESEKESIDIRVAFGLYNRDLAVKNIFLGCILGMLLMPLGFLLDVIYVDDSEIQFAFLRLRFLCSALIGLFWLLVRSSIGRQYHHSLGVFLAMLPAAFICWMIARYQGAASPYYAGLNLVMLFIGFLLQWTLTESVVAFSLILSMYLYACFIHMERTGADLELDIFGAHLFFLTATGVIMMTGNYFANKLRYREYAFRYKLDRKREELESTNQKLVELDRIKSRFFANISHELRTPLTLLLAPLEALIKEKKRYLDAQSNEWIGMMHTNGMRLLKLINDLLDLVRLESCQMSVDKKRVDMEGFVAGLCQSVRKLADDQGIRLSYHVHESVGASWVDRDKLEKILLNLVFNAIKFTPASGHVRVRCDRVADVLQFQVSDTGIGIESQKMPHLFTRFWQADSSSLRKFQGVGLGLALVKELVDLQGGEITAESQPGIGTRIRFFIPSLVAQSVVKKESPRVEQLGESIEAGDNEQWLSRLYRRAELFPAMTPMRNDSRGLPLLFRKRTAQVLVADDERDMLRFIRSQLAEHYEVLEAVNGRQALEMIKQFLPDLVILDMMMPELDGLDVCRTLRNDTSTKSIPVIILTARADDETRLTLLDAGANDFLAKPFSSAELHLRTRNLIQSRVLERQVLVKNKELESTLEQLKETEIQLIQSEKLVSLGRMSAGIIHEINNPLNYANTAIFTLKKIGRAIPEEERDDFNEIVHDVEYGVARIKTILSDLRGFTRSDDNQFEAVDLEATVEAALRFMSHEFRDDIDLECKVEEGLRIRGNANRLIQVLLNLMQNSVDAIRSGDLDKRVPKMVVEGRRRDGRVRLSIRDNGPGMDLETRKKAFDPFFTTKDVGKGMGLGLSISYRIIEQHGGRIDIESEPGQFCAFSLEFPDWGDGRSA